MHFLTLWCTDATTAANSPTMSLQSVVNNLNPRSVTDARLLNTWLPTVLSSYTLRKHHLQWVPKIFETRLTTRPSQKRPSTLMVSRLTQTTRFQTLNPKRIFKRPLLHEWNVQQQTKQNAWNTLSWFLSHLHALSSSSLVCPDDERVWVEAVFPTDIKRHSVWHQSRVENVQHLDSLSEYRVWISVVVYASLF